MRVISQPEFRDNFEAILDSVAAGEKYRITRNGIEVAELSFFASSEGRTSAELIERQRGLLRVDAAQMRNEADEFFGAEDRIGD